MSNLILAPFEPGFENITHELARFEALYAGKRELESEIENAIWEIDRIATSELKSAEEELQDINLKCAAIRVRLTRAGREPFDLGKEIPSTNDAMKGVDPIILSPRKDGIRIPENTPEDNISIEEPIPSPVSASCDLDSFTVISDIDAESSRALQFTEDTEVLTFSNVLDSTTSESDRLISLVQRYHSLRCTIDNLRNSINKQTEEMNESALAKFEHAKMRLEMSRGKAREIVEGMRKTSERKVNVRFPWMLLEDGTRRRLSIAMPPPFPAFRAALHLDNGFNDKNSSSGPEKCDSRGPLTPPPTSHPHSPTFEKYDVMMNIIRGRLPGDLWPWDVPWPVLPRSIHKFPVKSSHYLLAGDVVGNSVKQFVESYASWKARPIHRVRTEMLTDWISIVDKTSVWKAGQKDRARLIVHHLSDSE